jgi:hypothetical protein
MNDMSQDITFEREVANIRNLSIFRKNATTWELLLLLAQAEGESDLGLYNTIAELKTGYMGQSALLKFLRQRREEGVVEFLTHEKRSMWRMKLDPEVLVELRALVAARNRRIASRVRASSLARGLTDLLNGAWSRIGRRGSVKLPALQTLQREPWERVSGLYGIWQSTAPPCGQGERPKRSTPWKCLQCPCCGRRHPPAPSRGWCAP